MSRYRQGKNDVLAALGSSRNIDHAIAFIDGRLIGAPAKPVRVNSKFYQLVSFNGEIITCRYNTAQLARWQRIERMRDIARDINRSSINNY